MAVLSSLIVLSLEMFLEVSASSGQYRGAWYQPVEHHALLGKSFMNISGISAVRCSARCLSHRKCLSFNYDHINRVCQMNNAVAEHVYDNFQEAPNFSYYAATAKPKSCKENNMLTYGDGNGTLLKACCQETEKLGVEDGSIPDERLSASSNFEGIDTATPAGGRLNKNPPSPRSSIIGAWCPDELNTTQWIQVDLGNQTCVNGVLTQGRSGWPQAQWVTKYKVQFKPPSSACLVDVKDRLGQAQIFNGNFDRNSIVERRFFKPVLAVKIRIVPVEWHEFIALRFELLGLAN